MFTNTKAGYVRDGKVLTESACLSTDTKPTTGIANGSCLIEMDTGDRFMFDEAGSQWLNITTPGGGGGAEVWLVGDTYSDQDGERLFPLSNAGATDYMTELFNNAEDYIVYLNGAELVLFSSADVAKVWADSDDEASITKAVEIDSNGQKTSAGAMYPDASTAPTSVEVSVKAK